MGLPDPEKSAAVIIGVASYAKKSPFDDLPAVKNNVADLASVLTDPQIGHLTRDRCPVLLDYTHPTAVLKAIRREAAKATDTFTIYFAGHGERGRDGSLYLVLKNGNHDDLPYTGIDFDQIREVMTTCRARRRIVILDCCYSGIAIGKFMSNSDDAISSQTRIAGTYTLTSSGQNKASSAPEGELYTAFTGELITLLKDGLHGAGEFLRVIDLFPVLRDRLIAARRPKPVQCLTEQVGDLALTRNLAFGGNGREGYDGIAEGRRGGRSDQAHEGSWFGVVDRRQGVRFVASVPPLPSRYPDGVGGAPSIIAWTVLATLIAWNQWFSFVYVGLLVAGAAGIVLETGTSPADRYRRAGTLVIVMVAIAYGVCVVASAVSASWGLAFWDAIAVLLYVNGVLGRYRYQAQSARLAEIREREEGKPDYQRISEGIDKSPIAAKLKTERWLGESLDSPVINALSHLPSARFINMGKEIDLPDPSLNSELRKPQYVAVCGRLVVALYSVRWKAGSYRRAAGPTKDLRRNGKIYGPAWDDVADVVNGVSALKSKVKEAEILGLVIVSPQPMDVRSFSKSNVGAVATTAVEVTDENVDGGDVLITTEERAAEVAGPFLAKEPYEINLDVVASLLKYASIEARADAGLSRYGTRRLTG